jgi:hypothetical protein
MEFGRKGDAKKAMRIMWREGITLKQAWKKVKGGKKSKSRGSPRKRKSRGSPRKRKAVSNAKKAMRLHHREGITLKQAWKRVNRFGDTVCQSGYEMNPKWNGRNPNHQCIKECGFLQSRDPLTNRCKGPLGGVKEASPKAPKIRIPKPGYEINPLTGRERKMCLVGEYRDPNTGRCRKIRPQLQPLIAPPFRSGGLMDYGKNRFGRRTSFGTCASCNLPRY